MTLQEMHEAVAAKCNAVRSVDLVFRLYRVRQESWRAAWGGTEWIGVGLTAQEAIDSAFRLAMES